MAARYRPPGNPTLGRTRTGFPQGLRGHQPCPVAGGSGKTRRSESVIKRPAYPFGPGQREPVPDNTRGHCKRIFIEIFAPLRAEFDVEKHPVLESMDGTVQQPLYTVSSGPGLVFALAGSPRSPGSTWALDLHRKRSLRAVRKSSPPPVRRGMS
jgi:hypothetical protein